MDNSEVDLFHILTPIWENKIKILIYTLLIVFGSVLYSYLQPKYYEIQKTAFIIRPENNASEPRKVWPLEYYETLSRSPEVLDLVLENLPKEVKLDDNVSLLGYLSSILSVQGVIIHSGGGFASPAFKFVFYVRCKDPLSARIISNTWQSVLESKFSQLETEGIKNNYPEEEEQLKLSKAKWDMDKKRLGEFRKKHSSTKEIQKLESLQRLIRNAYYQIETIADQENIAGVLILKSAEIKEFQAKKMLIEENYLTIKETLAEYKRLLDINLNDLNEKLAKNKTQDSNKTKNKFNAYNSAYFSLQEKIIDLEVNLKVIDGQRNRLVERIRDLESDMKSVKSMGEGSEFVQNQSEINKVLGDNIKLYELDSKKLESRISKNQLELENLIQQELVSAELFRLNSVKLEKLRLSNSSKLSVPNFSYSAMESVGTLGNPMQRIIFVSFICGLVFMILVTLIKANFVSQKDK
ncbi:MAG: hypothetical protein HOJ13_02500 [Nitrospina sp.]|nr:hypothetical protein [Nitrospina sp.]MBT5975155.1 hypothetical protein [Flavobacteriaceae bacterium]